MNEGTSDYVGVYAHVTAETGACSGAAAGPLPQDIAGYLNGRSDLETTKPRPVSVGGLDGVVLNVQAAEGAKAAPGVVSGCVIMGAPPSDFEHGPGPRPGLLRLYLLETSEGSLAIEIADVTGGSHLDNLSKVVADFHFGS